MENAKSILVVDDDVTFLKIIKNWLSAQYHVTVVKSGLQTLKYVEGHSPDLILMDYSMPEMDGPELLAKIRSNLNTKDIPVMFLTGKEDQETANQILKEHIQGYLVKTMHQQDILDAIEKYFLHGA